MSDTRRKLGTGFLYMYQLEGATNVPVVVTNRHVLEDAEFVSFTINKADNNGQPILGDTLTVSTDWKYGRWIPHPDDHVDLAIIPLAPALTDMQSRDLRPFLMYLSSALVPSNDQWNQLTAIEDIVMIGYPVGISDTVNNLPTVRKGITATHPRLDFNGKKEFLVDAAIFPGSSGSPVFIVNEGSYSVPGGIAIGSRLFLLGIAYAYYYRKGNNPVISEIPTEEKTTDGIEIPINLGSIIKSTRLSEFEPILVKLAGSGKEC